MLIDIPTIAESQVNKGLRQETKDLLNRAKRDQLYALQKQVPDEAKEIFNNLSEEEANKFIPWVQGLVPYEEGTPAMIEARAKYIKIRGRTGTETQYLKEKGAIKEETIEDRRWRPIISKIAQEEGLIGKETWLKSDPAELENYNKLMGKRAELVGRKPNKKTMREAENTRQELAKYRNEGQEIMRYPIKDLPIKP